MLNRENIYRIAGLAGLNYLARKIFCNSLLVLSYHGVCGERPDIPDLDGLHVPATLFERQMRFLTVNYQPVTLHQVKEHVLAGSDLPDNAVLITFDDGYRNVLLNGLPVLRRLGIPCVLFPVPGLVEAEKWLWTSELEWQKGEEPDFARLRNWLKGLSSKERRTWIEAELENREERPRCEHSLLSWDELADLTQDPFVEIGSHGLNHEPLTGCGDEQLNRELSESRELLQSRLGVEIDAISYPNGDYSETVTGVAREAGYCLGFTTEPRHARSKENPLTIPRILVGRFDTPIVLAARLAGWQEWIRTV